MKRTLLIFILFLVFYFNTFAQEYTEYYFKFNIENRAELDILTQIISIDNVNGFEVFAYANKKEFDEFLKFDYKFELIPKEIPKSLLMATTVAEMDSWDRYPTYEVYRQMLKDFEANFSSICKLDSFGTSNDGRKLYSLRITDNIENEEDEPEFFYTSTIHGDETTGYVLLLRLADSLLNSYGSDPKLTDLINGIDLYINPNANPDGTYNGGNNTVSGAIRYNGYADLNRDFPDPRSGANTPYQVETQAMMDFASNHNFVMSANFHGGAEVMNYPWDTWYTSQNLHPDTDWFERICTNYVDTARLILPTFMTGITADGVTHGASWYRIDGGRQDYMNYWHQCREVTIEISGSKLLATESLNNYWNYNKESFINYITECLFGIRGTVKNQDGKALDAKIWVLDHDNDFNKSMVFTDSNIGNYHRLIEPGTYDIAVSSYGYISDTIRNIQVLPSSCTMVDIVLNKNENTHLLSGKITDAIDNTPIENVLLRITNAPFPDNLTDENGFYNFYEVLEDTINILVQKEGFTPLDTNILFFSPDTIYDFKLYPAKIEDFESKGFNKFDWNFLGNANWIISEAAFEGTFSATSGDVVNSESSIMYFNEVITKDGYISFYKKISSEGSYDFLKFYIDGVEKGRWSGISDWSFAQYAVSKGVHTFKWEYIKDGNTSNGSDCAWVDLISLPANDTSLYISPINIYDTLNINETSEHKLFIKNSGNVSNEYTLEKDQTWIDFNISSQIINYKETDTILLNINTANLKTAYYSSKLVVSSKNNQIDTVNIYLMIRDTISSKISPKLINDTLWGGENKTYDLVISNVGSVLVEYTTEIENATEHSWINLNVASGSLLLTESDTIKASINTSNMSFGESTANIIFREQDEDSDTISIRIFVYDPISYTIIPSRINDTLWAGDFNNYNIIVENTGYATLGYTVEIENQNDNSWLNIDKLEGNVVQNTRDTVVASINTSDRGFGDFYTNIIFKGLNQINDTIPIQILIKDTIDFEIYPYSITDTLDADSIKEYSVLIKNIGYKSLRYSSALQFPSKSDLWINQNKENGEIAPQQTDTIILTVNTYDLITGNYVCALSIEDNMGINEYLFIPIDIFVKNLQSLNENPDISKFKIYPNPFTDQLIVEFIPNTYEQITMKILNIRGNTIFSDEISVINNKINSIVINDYYNVNQLPNGFYFFQIFTSNSQFTRKILKD